MKKIPCSFNSCYTRRPHYMLPDEERGIQYVEVNDDYEGEVYCSLTCAMLAGKLSARQERKDNEERSET